MFIYKYSQLTNRMAYGECTIKEDPNKTPHLGQLKLLISEIMFLTRKAQPGNKILYIGVAEGYHISYLADMSPDLNFDLWDKTKFRV